jgi:hypothetical protein
MFVKSRFAAAVLLLAASSSALAAEPAAPAAGTGSACEIHVWPTDQYMSSSTGLLSGFGAVGALVDVAGHSKTNRTVKDLMMEYLDSAGQNEALTQADIAATLRKPGATIVFEPLLPLETRKKVGSNPARLTASTAPCYGELVVGLLFYQRAAMHGTQLYDSFIYRDFSRGGGKPAIYKGMVKNPLKLFPDSAATDEAAARSDLKGAFTASFLEYTQKKVFKGAR